MTRYTNGRWLGVALLVLGVGVSALTYPPSPVLGAQMTALAAAGAFLVLAGTANPLRERAGPHRLMGAGEVLLGASLAISGVAGTGGDDLVYIVASLVGGASLLGIGLGYIFRPTAFGLGADGYPNE